MSEQKHTPGPWRVGDAGCTVFGPKTDAPLPKIVASISNGPIVGKQNMANARLIAAAPELLEALKSMLKHYAPSIMECELWALGGNSQTDAILRLARAAIDKAEQ